MDIIEPYSYWKCPKCGKMENFVLPANGNKCTCKVKKDKIDGVMENIAILLLHSDKDSYMPLYHAIYMDDYTNDKVIQDAILASHQVRFEFNDKK